MNNNTEPETRSAEQLLRDMIDAYRTYQQAELAEKRARDALNFACHDVIRNLACSGETYARDNLVIQFDEDAHELPLFRAINGVKFTALNIPRLMQDIPPDC